jgi:hypothetical protein
MERSPTQNNTMEAGSAPAKNHAQLPPQGDGATDSRDVISQILRAGAEVFSLAIVNATAARVVVPLIRGNWLH